MLRLVDGKRFDRQSRNTLPNQVWPNGTTLAMQRTGYIASMEGLVNLRVPGEVTCAKGIGISC